MWHNEGILKVSLFISACVLLFVTGCASTHELTEEGQAELVQYIESLTESSTIYEVTSIQKAPGYSSSEAMTGNVSFTGINEVSGCPDDVGGRDMWCVVLDREIVSKTGETYSHFLVQRLNDNWYVEELGAKSEAEFYDLGCQNWDEVLVDGG